MSTVIKVDDRDPTITYSGAWWVGGTANEFMSYFSQFPSDVFAHSS